MITLNDIDFKYFFMYSKNSDIAQFQADRPYQKKYVMTFINNTKKLSDRQELFLRVSKNYVIIKPTI